VKNRMNSLLVSLKFGELYFIQARNSETFTEIVSISSSVRAKAQTAGISFQSVSLSRKRQGLGII
ncbi:TPA: hypothetical protein ACIRJA_001820, partial [Streptococcus suis]